MKVLFWLYQSRATSTGEAPIMMRVTHEGKRVNLTLDVRTTESQWDSKRQKVKGNSERSKLINEHLTTCSNGILKAYDSLCKTHSAVTVRQIFRLYMGEGIQSKLFIEAFDDYISNLQAKVGVDYVQGTVQVYRGTLSKIKKFLKDTQRLDITLNEVDRKFIADLDQYIRAVLRSANNTTVKNMKQLKSVFKYARIMGWMQNDPFDFMSFKQLESKREYLTVEEIAALNKADLRIPSLEKVRDLFLFQIYTGLSYQDLKNLSADDIKIGSDNRRWIYIYRTKTDTLSQIPLMPVPEDILRKYHNYKGKPADRLLPVLTNQVYNRYLKAIFKVAKINKHASSHMGRHTFATTILMSKGISMETISRLLGHSTPRTTEIYAKITERKIVGEVAVLWN